MNAITQRALRNGMRRQVDGPDYGTTIRLNRGEVEKTEGACPTDPNVTVRRGKVVCHYDSLWKRNGLTDEEREAADYYSKLLEMEAGARDRPVVKAGGRTPPWLQGHPTEYQVIAAQKLRKAHETIGQHGQALLRRFVGHNQPASDIAKQLRIDERQCLGRIRASLTRLAELWGMG